MYETILSLAHEHKLLGAWTAILQVQRFFDGASELFFPGSRFALLHQRGIDGNAHEPSLEAGIAAPAAFRFQGLQHRFLYRVFGVLERVGALQILQGHCACAVKIGHRRLAYLLSRGAPCASVHVLDLPRVCIHWKYPAAVVQRPRDSEIAFPIFLATSWKRSGSVLRLWRKTSARPSMFSTPLRFGEGNAFAPSNPAGSMVEGGLPESMPGNRSLALATG